MKIAPDLVVAIDALDAAAMWARAEPIFWLDIARNGENTMSPATAKVIDDGGGEARMCNFFHSQARRSGPCRNRPNALNY